MSGIGRECRIDEDGAQDAAVRPCAHPGCAEEGLHRAPAARDQLNRYVWFCLEHIRAYNLAWDYFRGMSEAEIERIRRNDTVWQRPTWPLGGRWDRTEAEIRRRLRRGFGFAGGETGGNGAARRPANPTEAALAALDLGFSASFTEVKQQYKRLAKRLHPDANGGDRRAEERLKVINQAYATLKKAYSP